MGFFDNLFDDNEPQSFFGGYRPRAATASNDPTPTDASLVPIDDQPSNAAPSQSAPAILTYPGGTPVVDPVSGRPYLRPPGLDMHKNLAIGQTIKDAAENSDLNIGQANPSLMFAPLFLPGSTMDYQRLNGTFGHREMQFRPIGYYNYGVMAAKIGYGREEALRNAGLYNRIAGGAYLGANSVNTSFGRPPTFDNPYGLDRRDAVDYVGQGYDDYQNGRWTQKSSDKQ